MKIAGFTAEASVYRTGGRYYMRMTHVGDGASISPALENCPPKCIADCKLHCHQDGVSASRCATLCASYCSAYSSLTLSCGPCVDGVQVCILCGGQRVTNNCCPVLCGGGCCSAGQSCCGNGAGCCESGYTCEDLTWAGLGWWCRWDPLSLIASGERRLAPPHTALPAVPVAAPPTSRFAVS
jgi:hypothetical protein